MYITKRKRNCRNTKRSKICISATQNNKYLCDHDRRINFPFKRHFNKLTLSRKSEGGEI